jgi:hypothetical protein
MTSRWRDSSNWTLGDNRIIWVATPWPPYDLERVPAPERASMNSILDQLIALVILGFFAAEAAFVFVGYPVSWD